MKYGRFAKMPLPRGWEEAFWQMIHRILCLTAADLGTWCSYLGHIKTYENGAARLNPWEAL